MDGDHLPYQVLALRSKRLISQRCEVVFQFVVFDFQRVRKYRETSGGIPQHCAKWLRNHFAAKGWFRSRAKFFLHLGVKKAG